MKNTEIKTEVSVQVNSDTKFLEDPRSKQGMITLLGLFILVFSYILYADVFSVKNFNWLTFGLDTGLLLSVLALFVLILLLRFTVRREKFIGLEAKNVIKERFKMALKY